MIGRTRPQSAQFARSEGVIADFEAAEAMLSHFIKEANQRRSMVRPRIVVCVPIGVTPEVEKRAVKRVCRVRERERFTWLRNPRLATGDLPVVNLPGNMIVDIGGGTTEVAAISLSGIVYQRRPARRGIRWTRQSSST